MQNRQKPFCPPPFDPANPRQKIIHPTGQNAPNFSEQEITDKVSVWIGIGLRAFIHREKNPPPAFAPLNPSVQPPVPKDGDFDEKNGLSELEKDIRANPRQQYFHQMTNKDAIHVILCTRKKRNSTHHNDLPYLASNLDTYLSAARILLGPDMINFPDGLAVVDDAFKKTGLVPLALSALPKYPQ